MVIFAIIPIPAIIIALNVQKRSKYMIILLKKLWNKAIGNWWEVRACCWPYPEGYGTYNPYKKMILNTGLTKEHAQSICDQLNLTVQKTDK
jgi:hypothetical protein